MSAIIDFNDYTPTEFKKSRDYQLFLLIMNIIFSNVKADTEDLSHLYNVNRCPDSILPLLGDFKGWEWDDKDTVENERKIIGAIPELLHNRGSNIGINNAVNVASSLIDSEYFIQFYWSYDRENNVITVYLYDDIHLPKIHDLIEVVRPFGTKVIYEIASIIKNNNAIEFRSFAYPSIRDIDPLLDYLVAPNNNPDISIVWDPTKELYEDFVNRVKGKPKAPDWGHDGKEDPIDKSPRPRYGTRSTRVGIPFVKKNPGDEDISDNYGDGSIQEEDKD